MNKRIVSIAGVVLAGFIGVFYGRTPVRNQAASGVTPSPIAPIPSAAVANKESLVILELPMDRLQERVSKKSFGLNVTPKNSPVSPERFSGYHTGVDFETFADEKDTNVLVRAACTGTVLAKRWVSGYGGVLIQDCTVGTQTVSVLYGHLNVTSISSAVGSVMTQGQVVGSLGKGYSRETDGERKHLHFSLHKGNAINLRGYVKFPSQLSAWVDPMTYFLQ